MQRGQRLVPHVVALLACLLSLLLLTGCLEQLQSPRVPSGSLTNFYMHLYAGELDDARTYFAPGLVAPSTQLDSSIQDASNNIRHYEIQRTKSRDEDLQNGEKQVTLSGRWRLRPTAGQPTPAPDSGWQNGDIITGRVVERGPGWRLLDFSIECCK